MVVDEVVGKEARQGFYGTLITLIRRSWSQGHELWVPVFSTRRSRRLELGCLDCTLERYHFRKRPCHCDRFLLVTMGRQRSEQGEESLRLG
jgi:hypothetical protein